MSIGDGSEGQPLMEELGDAEGLLGGWGAEGDTVQGEVIDSQGHTQQTSSQSTLTTTTYLNCQSRSSWHKHVLNNKGTLIQLGS